MSKTWLRRKVFGVALLPSDGAPSGRAADFLPFRNRDPRESAVQAVSALERRPDMPRRLQAAFREAWSGLEPLMRRVDPSWTAPRSGYFSLLRTSADTLLERYGIAAVPASVFGSREVDLSVVTCLHGLEPDSGSRQGARHVP